MADAQQAAMVQSCRLALAVAGQDEDEIARVISEATSTPEGPTLLLTTLAGTVAVFMQEKAGANWRAALAETVRAVGG